MIQQDPVCVMMIDESRSMC